jgi:hypothetical protein
VIVFTAVMKTLGVEPYPSQPPGSSPCAATEGATPTKSRARNATSAVVRWMTRKVATMHLLSLPRKTTRFQPNLVGRSHHWLRAAYDARTGTAHNGVRRSSSCRGDPAPSLPFVPICQDDPFGALHLPLAIVRYFTIATTESGSSQNPVSHTPCHQQCAASNRS